jgi:3-hydroxybutyryl-CoA dehydratase
VSASVSSGSGELVEGATIASLGRTVTETDVVLFGTLTGDLNPQHMDAAWAAGTPFGQRIAHGLLVVSYAVGLMPIDAGRVIALRRLDKVVFKRPVRIGDTIRVEARISRLRPADATADTLKWDLKVIRDDDQTVLTAKIDLLWRRASAVAEPVS